MRLPYVAASLLLVSGVMGAATPAETTAAATFQKMAETALNATLAQLDADVAAAKAAGQTPNCTRDKLQYRYEFGSMKKEDRAEYTKAVACLMNTTTKTPSSVAPGARSRFDDFIVTHILQTPFVHASGTFLGWHRWYLYIYEQVLRKECGYKGPIPYWDWSKWAAAPETSPMFNGDAYSIGGNGAYTATSASSFLGKGKGGGCVTTGPFGNMSIHLGPGPGSLPGSAVGPSNGLGYNPRCLKRDVGPSVPTNYNMYVDVMNVMNQATIAKFQDFMQTGKPAGVGIHGAGHYIIAGDPGGDFYVSPGDPAFYLHHGQIDRLWAIWQMQDPTTRLNAIAGTNTMNNQPPSANTKLTDVMNVGYAGGRNVTVSETLSTVRGEFCFVYQPADVLQN